MALVGALFSLAILVLDGAEGLLAPVGGVPPALPSADFLAAVVVGGAIFSGAEIVLFRSAFVRLAPLDAGFSAPASLALVALLGLLLTLLSSTVLLDTVYAAVQCAGPGHPIPRSCLDVGEFLRELALLLVTALLALIGFLGVVIGIWRLGTRYGDARLQWGAILTLIPLVNLVGAVLILWSARENRRRIEQGRPAPVSGF